MAERTGAKTSWCFALVKFYESIWSWIKISCASATFRFERCAASTFGETMQHLLNIVGTGHHYQFGVGVKYGAYACTNEDQSRFKAMLSELAVLIGADAIAEELSEQAMSEVGCGASVPQLVANELNLSHLFCDPNRAERQKLGIYDDNFIRVAEFPKILDEPTVKSRIAESWSRRENEWIRRLRGLDASRLIFICGSEHLTTFVPLALQNGFDVSVVHKNWQA